jgi:hypothetical protein
MGRSRIGAFRWIAAQNNGSLQHIEESSQRGVIRSI